MTYTPGPWLADTDSGNTFMVFPDGDETGAVLIAGRIKKQADAYLIAAAPDLLEAAVDILKDFRPLEKRDNSTLNKLATAVALATGVIRRD